MIDTSLALAWCFEDEATPEADAVADRVRDSGAFVPALWHWEIANALLQAERRRRITPADAASSLALLSELPVTTDGTDRDRVWDETLVLARAERLTVYDAAYLELATRLGATLGSLDRDLVAAAWRLGITALP